MRSQILENLIEKSNFAEIKFKPIDLTEQQDEMLDFLTNQCNTKHNQGYRSLATSVLAERNLRHCSEKEKERDRDTLSINVSTSPIMPISARKRFLFEQAQGICSVLQIDEIIV